MNEQDQKIEALKKVSLLFEAGSRSGRDGSDLQTASI